MIMLKEKSNLDKNTPNAWRSGEMVGGGFECGTPFEQTLAMKYYVQ